MPILYNCSTYKTLEVDFDSPLFAPANGYVVKWRPVGTVNWNTVIQNQIPVIVAGVPTCFNIEGTIQADCGNGNLSNPVVFSVSSTTTVCRTFRLLETAAYTYTSCTSGNTITVNNQASIPSTVCAIDGTVQGGQFTDLNQTCNP